MPLISCSVAAVLAIEAPAIEPKKHFASAKIRRIGLAEKLHALIAVPAFAAPGESRATMAASSALRGASPTAAARRKNCHRRRTLAGHHFHRLWE